MKYNEKQSKVIEFIFIPIYINSLEENYKEIERNFLQEYRDDLEFIRNKLKKVENELKENYIIENNQPLVFNLYINALNDNKNFITIKEFCSYLLTLDEKDIISALKLSKEQLSREELIKIINDKDVSVEEKWYLTNAIFNPQKIIEKIVEILKYIESFYEEIYTKYKNERKNYAKNFSIENLMGITNVLGKIDDIKQGDNSLLVLSPLLPTLIYLEFPNNNKKILVLGTLIDKVLSEDTNVEKNFADIIKTISDSTRYDILKMLSTENIKTKDIAEVLNISSAAVSFHIRKLIDSQFLVFSKERSKGKFSVNKQLIENIIKKLEKDFI